MKFAAVVKFNASDPRITEVRPVHRQYLAGLLANGKLAISGPFTDGAGALLVYDAETQEEAESLLKADPFAQAGLFASWSIHPWTPVYANPDLLVPHK